MKRAFNIICLLAGLFISVAVAHLPTTQSNVAVLYDHVRIPIGTTHTFQDIAAQTLPPPRLIAPSAKTQHAHNENIYCWRFNNGILKLIESDFGMFTAVLAKPTQQDNCPALNATPLLSIAGVHIGLQTDISALHQNLFPTYTLVKQANQLHFSKLWTEHEQASHICRHILITATITNKQLQHLSVMNWAEPGQCH